MVSKIAAGKVHLSLKVMAVIVWFWGVPGCQKPEVCMQGITDDFVIDDALAISLSRNALIKRGIEVSNMVPVPYSDDPKKLFARNAYKYNSGYVLWHKLGDDSLFEYSVSIEKQGDKIYCDAGKTL